MLFVILKASLILYLGGFFMRIGICGYGNIGRAVEDKVLESQHQLVGIFTRRQGVQSIRGTKVIAYDKMPEFEGKIDVMLMCGGSQEDLLWQSPEALKYFDIIDTFDTHARIQEHASNLENVANLFGHRAIYSCGWDPGVFSLMRCLSASIFHEKPETFWGKGVSQGHSEALRNIRGIADAIEFTVPCERVLERVKTEKGYHPDDNLKHERHCYIALDQTRPETEVIEEIKSTENYFKDQQVFVNVVSLNRVQQLKGKMYHKGYVFAGDAEASMTLEAKMDSNPAFTAKIMLAYANALSHLPSGAYSVLDVPVAMLEEKKWL